jgi:hypothetical protein
MKKYKKPITLLNITARTLQNLPVKTQLKVKDFDNVLVFTVFFKVRLCSIGSERLFSIIDYKVVAGNIQQQFHHSRYSIGK